MLFDDISGLALRSSRTERATSNRYQSPQLGRMKGIFLRSKRTVM